MKGRVNLMTETIENIPIFEVPKGPLVLKIEVPAVVKPGKETLYWKVILTDGTGIEEVRIVPPIAPLTS